MTRPPTLDEARERGLLAAKEGVATFSNGTAWERSTTSLTRDARWIGERLREYYREKHGARPLA